MLYRTDDFTRWGAGQGSNLEPVQIDLNFWELAERLVAVEAAAGEAANGIASIGVVGSQMTVYLEDGTALGPYTLPTAMIHYRGDWTAATSYNEMDLVTVPDVGVYLVLQDHTSDAAFDALAEDAAGNPLYRFLFPMGTGGGGGASSVAQLTDVDLVSEPPTNGQTLVFFGDTWYPGVPTMALGDLAGVFPGTPTDGQVLTWVAADSAWRSRSIPASGSAVSVSDEGTLVLANPTDINFVGSGVTVTDDGDGTVTVTIPGGTGGGAGALSDLSDVTVTGPAAGQFLRYNGTIFVNAAVDWSDLANKPATFAPSAHQHPWSDLTGVPATFAPAAHTHPATEIDGAVVEAVAGTAYTQVAADRAKWKRTTSAAAVTITIDANVNATGDEITFQQGAAGAITFVAGAGMTLSSSGTLISGGEGAVVGIKFLSATEATLFGHTTAEEGGSSGGDMTAAVYDPQAIAADAFARANHTGEQAQSTITGLVADLAAKAAGADLAAHIGDTSNPHGVTKAQVGLGSVDNTADADKPVSAAVQAALDAKQPLASILTALAALGIGADGAFLGVASGALAWDTPAGGGGGSGLDDSQTWQDVSGSRSAGTTYQNTTGKSIFVAIYVGGAGKYCEVSSDNSTWVGLSWTAGQLCCFVVPDGQYYRTTAGATISRWAELR